MIKWNHSKVYATNMKWTKYEKKTTSGKSHQERKLQTTANGELLLAECKKWQPNQHRQGKKTLSLILWEIISYERRYKAHLESRINIFFRYFIFRWSGGRHKQSEKKTRTHMHAGTRTETTDWQNEIFITATIMTATKELHFFPLLIRFYFRFRCSVGSF